MAFRGGAFIVIVERDDPGSDDPDRRFEPEKQRSFIAACDGFDIQAAVRIEAHDEEGRERLVHYAIPTYR